MSDALTWIGLGLGILGIVLAIVAGVFAYRTSIRNTELQRDRGFTPNPADERRLLPQIRAGTAEPEDLTALQLTARMLISRQIRLLGWGALGLTQLGSLLAGPSTFRIAFVCVIGLILLAAAVPTIRNARAARAFLARYPIESEVQR